MAIGALRGVPAEGVADKQQSGENRSGLLGSEGAAAPFKSLDAHASKTQTPIISVYATSPQGLTLFSFCAKFTLAHSPIV